jgi:hypothetical protein
MKVAQEPERSLVDDAPVAFGFGNEGDGTAFDGQRSVLGLGERVVLTLAWNGVPDPRCAEEIDCCAADRQRSAAGRRRAARAPSYDDGWVLGILGLPARRAAQRRFRRYRVSPTIAVMRMAMLELTWTQLCNKKL